MSNDEDRIVTRGSAWRSLLVILAAGLSLFGVVAAFGTVQDMPEPVASRTVIEALGLPAVNPNDAGGVYFREDRYQRKDTPAAALERLGVDESEVEQLLNSSHARVLRLLRPGSPLEAQTSAEGRLVSLSFLSSRDTLISVGRAGEGFAISEQPTEIASRIEMRSGEIESSLFAATDAAGLPDNIAVQIADIFSGDVDFHRDLRRGDRFTVIYETYLHAARAVRSGRVLAAEFASRGKTYRAVWFQDDAGKSGYYMPDGKNMRRAFLRSPIAYSRISSGFGMRRHPIMGAWKAHAGIDYAAPYGTRVKATSDGIVEFAGRQGNYGIMVKLRHAGGYGTLYAHLSGVARGLRGGSRVAQGDVIGYVGKTGLATGSHLHYEFHVNRQNRNPLTIAFPSALPIPDQQRTAFARATGPLVARLDLLKNTNLAMLE